MSQHSSFEGKYAIITGSTQGLGETTARLFAERGAAGIIITGRNAERGNAVVDSLKAEGCDARFVQASLDDVESCQKIVSAADEAWGKVHVLVNGAALTERGSIWNTTPEFFDKMMAVNVRAPFFLMQETLKIMKREDIEGSVVNVTSIAAHGSEPFLTPYAASKGALVILTKNVAYAVMRHRIRINAINLGWMDTPGEDVIQRRYHSYGQDWLAEAEANQPFGRLIKMDEASR
ncbi:MAG: SDR family oxidoreductase, partial [Chloroflexota bacterium]